MVGPEDIPGFGEGKAGSDWVIRRIQITLPDHEFDFLFRQRSLGNWEVLALPHEDAEPNDRQGFNRTYRFRDGNADGWPEEYAFFGGDWKPITPEISNLLINE